MRTHDASQTLGPPPSRADALPHHYQQYVAALLYTSEHLLWNRAPDERAVRRSQALTRPSPWLANGIPEARRGWCAVPGRAWSSRHHAPRCPARRSPGPPTAARRSPPPRAAADHTVATPRLLDRAERARTALVVIRARYADDGGTRVVPPATRTCAPRARPHRRATVSHCGRTAIDHAGQNRLPPVLASAKSPRGAGKTGNQKTVRLRSGTRGSSGQSERRGRRGCASPSCLLAGSRGLRSAPCASVSFFPSPVSESEVRAHRWLDALRRPRRTDEVHGDVPRPRSSSDWRSASPMISGPDGATGGGEASTVNGTCPRDHRDVVDQPQVEEICRLTFAGSFTRRSASLTWSLLTAGSAEGVRLAFAGTTASPPMPGCVGCGCCVGTGTSPSARLVHGSAESAPQHRNEHILIKRHPGRKPEKDEAAEVGGLARDVVVARRLLAGGVSGSSVSPRGGRGRRTPWPSSPSRANGTSTRWGGPGLVRNVALEAGTAPRFRQFLEVWAFEAAARARLSKRRARTCCSTPWRGCCASCDASGGSTCSSRRRDRRGTTPASLRICSASSTERAAASARSARTSAITLAGAAHARRARGW